MQRNFDSSENSKRNMIKKLLFKSNRKKLAERLKMIAEFLDES